MLDIYGAGCCEFLSAFCGLLTTATHRNALQHAATHCNTHCNTLQHIGILWPATATHCNAWQRTATHRNAPQRTATHRHAPPRTVMHCITHCNAHCNAHYNTLQCTATHCTALQHIRIPWPADHVMTLVPVALHYSITHCNTHALQHTLQHIETQYSMAC